ncbi:MAG: hypothetical protein M0T84_03145 [Betaproteobacteria bacterium]|nr:hypothetical protein [Betaproteobacteria bacterium]
MALFLDSSRIDVKLIDGSDALPLPGRSISPGTPLWQIVPTHDDHGRPLADLMMLIPGLRNRPQQVINNTLANLRTALVPYREVVFVHLDLKLNILWISLTFRPGIVLDLAAAVRRRVPEALLVAHQQDSALRPSR